MERLWRTLVSCAVTILAGLMPIASAAEEQDGYLSVYAFTDSRYNDTAAVFDAYKTLGMPNSRLRPYVDLLVGTDTQGAVGNVPIFGDHYALGALGLQYKMSGGLRAFVQAGATTHIDSVSAVPDGGDVRLGLQDYRGWSSGSFYGSTIYYSRYSNSVLYVQADLGRPVRRWQLEPFARMSCTLDTRGFYFFNVSEMTVGVRVHPLASRALSFALEQAAGVYLRNASRPPGIGPLYHDFRPTISYGTSI